MLHGHLHRAMVLQLAYFWTQVAYIGVFFGDWLALELLRLGEKDGVQLRLNDFVNFYLDFFV